MYQKPLRVSYRFPFFQMEHELTKAGEKRCARESEGT